MARRDVSLCRSFFIFLFGLIVPLKIADFKKGSNAYFLQKEVDKCE
ncbi:hypothetical protein CSC12_3317 [Klebsiella michiganensis]|nr:hypothetical protein CSC12_3317 [Klebsiella michiganensis]